MKKKILLACLFAIISTTSAYCACDGGTTITNTAGSTFCKSNTYMNWWSAQAWCQANGSRLATMYEMCPSWDGNEGSDECPELNGLSSNSSKTAWSATVYGSNYAFVVNLLNGSVYGDPYYTSSSIRHSASAYAFCR